MIEYRISKNEISKKKRSPFFVAIYSLGLVTLFYLPKLTGDPNYFEYFTILGIITIIATGSNALGSYNFIKYSKTHRVIVTSKGLLSHEPDTEELLPWNNVSAVSVKKNRNGLKS